MCSEETDRVLIRANRNSIEQLQRDERMLANMVMSQQVAIAQMQARLREQELLILSLCQEREILKGERI